VRNKQVKGALSLGVYFGRIHTPNMQASRQ